MVCTFKKVAIGTLLMAAGLFAQVSVAGPLTIDLGGFVCVDNTACDTNPLLNVMTVSNGVGGVPTAPGYFVTIATSFSNNPGSQLFNILDVTWTVNSIGTPGGPLTILVSQTGFNVGPVGANAQLESVCGGDVLNGSATCQEWANLSNTLFGLGPITPGAQGPFTAPFTSDLFSAPYTGTVPYALTDRLIFNLGANGTSTGDLRSTTHIPEPGTLLLVGAALAGAGLTRRRKQS
jgi:hypothetical protein